MPTTKTREPRISDEVEVTHPSDHHGERSASKSDLECDERSTSWLGRLGLLSAAPLVFLALSTLTGLGLVQNLPSYDALLAAVGIGILPALGLSTLFGGTRFVQAIALWLWSWVLLFALPSYFPEQREPATRVGLRFFAMPLNEDAGMRVVESGMSLLALFGPEPDFVFHAEASMAPQTPHPETPPLKAPRTSLPSESVETRDRLPVTRERSTRIPYTGDGRAIQIELHADGPEFGEELRFNFDTGATLTTLNRRTLELLDIPIPPDAPTIIIHTASGEMEASLVLVDAIWLGNEVVEWVTIAVCEPCAGDDVVGLLGLNISSHFRVSIDHEAKEIEFVANGGRRNRRLDIQPWLKLNAVLSRWDDGRIEVQITIENQAPREISSSVLEFTCSEERFTVRLDPIAAHETRTIPTSLPWGSQCKEFQIRPIAASWKIDRF